ncbi:MAG: hypothetical protein ACD_28C00027G0002 [uncultured bacterium]|nr:MAG: hypothetical protein ACD_28C00027G0002 [uncultured bacterium]
MMTEGEPQLQSSHPKIQQFFERLDQGVGTTQTKETGLSLIPQEKRDQLHRLAARLEELFAAGSPSFADVLEALKLPPYNVELKGDQRARTGFYKTLHSVSGERLGREGEQKAKPGFKLTVAMIPRGWLLFISIEICNKELVLEN